MGKRRVLPFLPGVQIFVRGGWNAVADSAGIRAPAAADGAVAVFAANLCCMRVLLFRGMSAPHSERSTWGEAARRSGTVRHGQGRSRESASVQGEGPEAVPKVTCRPSGHFRGRRKIHVSTSQCHPHARRICLAVATSARKCHTDRRHTSAAGVAQPQHGWMDAQLPQVQRCGGKVST